MKKKQERTVILVDNSDLLAFALPLAPLLRQDRYATVIPISPDMVNDWPKREEEIEDMLIEYWGERGLEISPVEKPQSVRIKILGLHPWSEEDQEPLWRFAERYGEMITDWTDNHEWPNQSFLKGVRRMCPTLKVGPGELLLDLLNPPRYPKSWKKSEYVLSYDQENIDEDKIAFRLLAAFSIACSLENNTGRPYTIPCFFLSLDELVYHKYNPTITRMVKEFEAFLDFPKKVKRKIRVSRRSIASGRPIAYANLGEVAEYIDIMSLTMNIAQEYPWLCAIKANGELYAWSEFLDLRDISSSYKDYQNLNIDLMLKILKGEVKAFRPGPPDPPGS